MFLLPSRNKVPKVRTMSTERNKAPPAADLDANYVTRKAAALVRQLHGCFVGATEFNGGWAMGERPDAILFSGQGSFPIETKITRSDFLADAKKEFRANSGLGVGRYRYYACPDGLIQPEELPDKWGLIYVFPNNKRARMIVGYGGRIKIGEGRHPQYGWRVPLFEHHGCTEPESIKSLPGSHRHPEYPANRYAFHDKHTCPEWNFLLYLAKRYKQQKFLDNVL